MSKNRSRHVWFVALPDTELLDVSGPWAVLGYANEVVGREIYRSRLIAPSAGDVRTRHGLMLSGALSLNEAARLPAADMLVVAGSSPTLGLSPPELEVAAWLRARHRGFGRIVSVCIGAFVLGEAGLLNGRRATTHWQYRDELRRRFPAASVAHDEIFLRDGRVWTSAGINAGIDLMLAVLEEDHGPQVAMSVAKNLVLFLRRSGRQAQFSQVLQRQEREPTRLRGLSALILENLDKPLRVSWLAQELGLSARSLTRWCDGELGETPAAHIRRIRLEEAQRLLEQTTLPLKTIAARVGLGDASTLWRLFMGCLDVSPAEYRNRFAIPQRSRRS